MRGRSLLCDDLSQRLRGQDVGYVAYVTPDKEGGSFLVLGLTAPLEERGGKT